MRLGYMRRIPGPPMEDAAHYHATLALAAAIYGVPAGRIALTEAHGIVGFLFTNTLEVHYYE